MDLFRYLMTKNGHNYLKDDDLFSYKLAKGQGGTYAIFEGTTINANNTRRGKMKLSLKGNTSQTGTPTPDNPIPVNVVSGDNEVVVTGKNIFDESYYSDTNLYASASIYFAYVKMPDSFKTKFYGNMTLKGTSQNLVFGFSTSNIGVSSRMLNNGTLQSNVEYDFTSATDVYLIIGNSNRIDIARDIPLIFNNYNIMISKTSGETYEPYQSSTYPIHLGTYELCKIGDYQDKFIKTDGKQLFNGIMELGILDGDTGQPVSNSSYMRCKDFIPVKELTDYSIKSIDITNINLAVYEYKEDYSYNLSSNKIIYNGNTLLTTNSGTKFIKFRPMVANTDLSSRFMVNEGSTLLPYEPYGNGDWYLEKELAKTQVSLGGTVYDIGIYKGSICQPPNKAGLFNGTAYCSKSLIATTVEERVENRFYENPANFMFIGSSTDTATTLKEKFDGSDLYYVLATPTYTKIEGTLAEQLNALQNLRSYDGQTNINQNNNDLASNMEAQILVNE